MTDDEIIYLEWRFQRSLLRGLLDAAVREPVSAGTLRRTWLRLESLAAASIEEPEASMTLTPSPHTVYLTVATSAVRTLFPV